MRCSELNSWLEDADIGFDPRLTTARSMFERDGYIGISLKGDFKSGGRLFRGFWQTLPKRARLLGISIEGEGVVELDYSQLNPMLAYARVRCSPPSGDAYTLPGLEQYPRWRKEGL